MKVAVKQHKHLRYVQYADETHSIASVEDSLDLLASCWQEDVQHLFVNREQFSRDFFDLSNQIAGQVLQKFVTYGVQLTIIGDFPQASPSLRDFMRECNRGNAILFAESHEAAYGHFCQ